MKCTREDTVSITNDLFNKNNVLWENSMNRSTDRVQALTAIHEGFQVKVVEITPNMKFTHRLAVAASKSRPEMNKIIQDATDGVYMIKIRPLIYRRILTVFCNEDVEV